MKAFTLLFAVVALLLSTAAAYAQSNPQQSGTQATQPQQQDQSMQAGQSTQTTTGSAQKMSAKVSSNGKTVVSNQDNKSYKVSNPGTLKNYEGQDVALVVQVDPYNNTIHIISVTPLQP